jgi:LytS/YehU family sensor histidine kinase
VNLAEIYVRRNNIKKAEYYSNEAFQLSKGDPYLRYLSYLSLGRIASKKGNYDEALQNLFLSRKISDEFGLLWNRAEICQEIALTYEKKKDYQKAYQYFKEYHEVSNKTLNETMTRQVSEMQAKYDAGVKDEQIKRLSHAKEMVEAENEKSRLMAYFMIFTFVSVSVIGVVIARNLILKQRISNKALSEKNAITQLQKEQVERANMVLVAEKTVAQYEVLKSKINPHFLFNSLSTLTSLIVKSKESALLFVENFADLYRRILETSDQQLTSLGEEIEVVKRYLFLQQIEFGENLTVQMNITQAFLHKKIPPFALQMVVENAVKHNIISSRQPLHINISSVSENHLVVENTLQLRRNRGESTGIAIKNISARYRLISDIQPTFEELETVYRVTLPLINNQPANELYHH